MDILNKPKLNSMMKQEWKHKALIRYGKYGGFQLLGYNIWDFEWVEEKYPHPIKVINPFDGRRHDLQIVSIQVSTEQKIRFGYIKFKTSDSQVIKPVDYGIFLYKDDLEWKLKEYPISNKNYLIKGVNIWEYSWFTVGKAKVKDPFYNYDIEIDIVKIYADNIEVIFGVYEAGESNWVIFEEKLKGKEKSKKRKILWRRRRRY